jgi:hypothetical protein
MSMSIPFVFSIKRKNFLTVFSHFVRAFNLLGRWAGLGYNTDEPSKHYVPTTSVRAASQHYVPATSLGAHLFPASPSKLK